MIRSFATFCLTGFTSLILGQPLTYTSPSCGPAGGSPAWACKGWPTKVPPELGPAGSIMTDPDTKNRVLRVTSSGAFGEDRATAFKALDAGWRQAWNSDSTRLLIVPWSNRPPHSRAYWVGFDPQRMRLTGKSGKVPDSFGDIQWDQNDPDLVVGLANDAAAAYNVRTGKTTLIYNPAASRWQSHPWISGWGGNRVCIADGPQDTGSKLVCYDRSKQRAMVIDLHSQTIDGRRFPVTFRGQSVELPSSIGVHTVTLAPDGDWLAIDTHGNAQCSVPGLPKYADTGIFLNLREREAYEWNTACGGTHWAYGFNGVMMQSVSPKWTPAGNQGPCNSDSRGIARRNTDSTIDSSYVLTGPCSFFDPATWAVNVHLSWTNNKAGDDANRYPVLLATISDLRSGSFLSNEVAAMQTDAAPSRGKLWRFAQTWNDATKDQCVFLEYSSPSISPDGRWAVFPSNWRGQTGTGGVCTNGNRTDVFVFELR